MSKSVKKSLWIIIMVVLSCVLMAIIETVVEPAYFVKSALKIVFFFFVPIGVIKLQREKVFTSSFLLNKRDALKLSLLGLMIYAVIMVAFSLTKGFFDYENLVNPLSSDQNVSPDSFIWVALYISFCNSLLEEFLFRFIAFIKLSQYISKKHAYIFSSCMFAIYHVAMIGTSFPLPLTLLALAGIAIGGVIFDYVDDKGKSIYNSWVIHMFADFAIMTIWFIHI